MFTLDMTINNCAVSVLFEFTGPVGEAEINYETLDVIAFLPVYEAEEKTCTWVLVNDLMSDKDMEYITSEIHWRISEIEDQFRAQDW